MDHDNHNNLNNDALRALIFSAPLGAEGVVSAPPTFSSNYFVRTDDTNNTNATKRSFEPSPVALPLRAKMPKKEPLQLGVGPWKHAGLLQEYGGVKRWCKEIANGRTPQPLPEYEL